MLHFGIGRGLVRWTPIAATVPKVFFDFVNNIINGATLSVVRTPGTFYAPNAAGALSSFAPNTLRQTDLGLLAESQIANGIRNDSFQGAVPGTPGTSPTNYSMTSTSSGVTRTIVGIGTEDGYDYMDVKYTATDPTAAAAFFIVFEGATIIVAAPGDTWTHSLPIRIVAGSIANLLFTMFITEANAAGVTQVFSAQDIIPSAGATTIGQQIKTLSRFFSDPDTLRATCSFRTAVAAIHVPLDVTIRFGNPKLERQAISSSHIRTTNAAVVRPPDAVTAAYAGGASGTVRINAKTAAGSIDGTLWAYSVNGAATDMLRIWRDKYDAMHCGSYNGGVEVARLDLSFIDANTSIDLAFAWDTTSYYAIVNGDVLQTVTGGAVPVGLNRLHLGGDPGGVSFWNGWLRSVAIYDRVAAVPPPASEVYQLAGFRGQIPSGRVLAPAGQECSESLIIVPLGDCDWSELRLLFQGFYIESTNVETDVGNDQVIGLAIQYPPGSAPVLITFDGAATGTIVNGVVKYTCDRIMPSLFGVVKFTRKTTIGIRQRRIVPTGGYHPIATAFTATGESAVYNNGTTPSQLMNSGAMIVGGGSVGDFCKHRPVLIGKALP